MGALCCVRSVGLLIVFLVWLFIPHHFAGAQSYGAMVVLCVFSVVLFSKMRVQRKRILLKKKAD